MNWTGICLALETKPAPRSSVYPFSFATLCDMDIPEALAGHGVEAQTPRLYGTEGQYGMAVRYGLGFPAFRLSLMFCSRMFLPIAVVATVVHQT